ncbi:MAG: hypothetical protein A2504_12160 [Bdellovibrionales bacterium RIFOXYD12_FULL_39_22]|nr:MAG: hypothetical protein A2504_12160 [Bdellovibrionales bacterium RIFOXYD12_FULL_39_22]
MFYRNNRSSKTVVISTIVLVAFFIGAVGFSYVYAQEGGGSKSSGVAESGFMDLVKSGGWVGHFIILCSVVGMGFVIEHIVNIKRDKLCPPEIVAELEALVEEGRYEEAVTLCSANPNFFCNIMGASLSKVNEGYDAMVEAMSTSGEEESAKLNMKISYISLIGNIAPMLGLTGTVTGMIASFGIIKTKLSPSPADLASGVEAALVTTVEGLLVSMPLMTAFFLFKNKVTLYIIEIGIMAGEFVDRFKNMSAEQPQ